ncbi:MAG: hypothetical protein WCO03_00580 [bacterium]
MKKKKIITIFLACIALVSVVYLAKPFTSGATGSGINFSGWGWASNWGWLGTDPIAGGGTQVWVDATDKKTLHGYAWSSNIGWIKFDPADTASAPTSPNAGAALAQSFDVDAVINVTGWVRACSIFVSGCAGTLRPDYERGGWDGWIKMNNVTLKRADASRGNARYLDGYAWGALVVGWVDLSQIKIDGLQLTCSATANVTDKVVTWKVDKINNRNVEVGGVLDPYFSSYSFSWGTEKTGSTYVVTKTYDPLPNLSKSNKVVVTSPAGSGECTADVCVGATPTSCTSGPGSKDCNEICNDDANCNGHIEPSSGIICHNTGTEKRCRLSTDTGSLTCGGGGPSCGSLNGGTYNSGAWDNESSDDLCNSIADPSMPSFAVGNIGWSCGTVPCSATGVSGSGLCADPGDSGTGWITSSFCQSGSNLLGGVAPVYPHGWTCVSGSRRDYCPGPDEDSNFCLEFDNPNSPFTRDRMNIIEPQSFPKAGFIKVRACQVGTCGSGCTPYSGARINGSDMAGQWGTMLAKCPAGYRAPYFDGNISDISLPAPVSNPVILPGDRTFAPLYVVFPSRCTLNQNPSPLNSNPNWNIDVQKSAVTKGSFKIYFVSSQGSNQ